MPGRNVVGIYRGSNQSEGHAGESMRRPYSFTSGIANEGLEAYSVENSKVGAFAADQPEGSQSTQLSGNRFSVRADPVGDVSQGRSRRKQWFPGLLFSFRNQAQQLGVNPIANEQRAKLNYALGQLPHLSGNVSKGCNSDCRLAKQ